jgi:hypothetical protein
MFDREKRIFYQWKLMEMTDKENFLNSMLLRNYLRINADRKTKKIKKKDDVLNRNYRFGSL